jgi:anion-transporting  ArsA/GET3 family ATPase
MNLLERRIVIVTGKGGVGKTTLCASLGIAAADRGARSIIVETAGGRRIAPLFGVPSKGYEIIDLCPGLSTLSLTPKEAIEDYIVQQLRFRRLYKMVFENRVMGPFLDAVPGLHDAVQLGKVWDLERQQDGQRSRWDLIIVDAPATGHGLTLLDSPAAMADLTRAGPMHRAVKQVQDLIENPKKTALVLVTLPEAIPVSETVDLYESLPDGARPLVTAAVLNEVWEERKSTSEELASWRDTNHPSLDEAADLLEDWIRRCQEQQQARERLAGELKLPMVEMPFQVNRNLRLPQLREIAKSLRPLFGHEISP